jgi:hypothetical protein
MLQRRKRYKNRTILGFKTLAGGTINMAQVGNPHCFAQPAKCRFRDKAANIIMCRLPRAIVTDKYGAMVKL